MIPESRKPITAEDVRDNLIRMAVTMAVIDRSSPAFPNGTRFRRVHPHQAIELLEAWKHRYDFTLSQEQLDLYAGLFQEFYDGALQDPVLNPINYKGDGG